MLRVAGRTVSRLQCNVPLMCHNLVMCQLNKNVKKCYVPKCVSKVLQTFDPSQVLQEAWQAKQVPDPEYMPGMHSLVITQQLCNVQKTVSKSQSPKYSLQNTVSKTQFPEYNVFE